MAKSKFYKEIRNTLNEGEVQNTYVKGFDLYFENTPITRPYQCDGLIDTIVDNHKCKVLIEFKYDKNLHDSVERAEVLAQVVYYLKRFERDGKILPNVCFVGDVNECFIMHTNALLNYLDFPCNWNNAPSSAYTDRKLVMAIANDSNINPFVFNIDDSFSFKDVADKIKDFASNIQRKVKVTEQNISTIYNYFTKHVVTSKKIETNKLVSIFINAITDKPNCHINEYKKNTLSYFGESIPVSTKGYEAFFAYFNDLYSPSEKAYFSKISDRLIEDEKRRASGEFYTPTPFVTYGHNMLTAQFGADWRKNYVVWDCCCGTKNLTRDYSFEYLYCSTLEQGELDQCGDYNKNATSFVFDFLNDSLDKLPQSLLDALKANKPIIFLINPPYATAGNWTNEKKTGCAKTMINNQMLNDKIGGCSQNLYTQFLYRIMMIKREFNLTDCNIAVYCPTLFLTGTSYINFRKQFLTEFKFTDAIQFKASYFSNVAKNWGISFSLWTTGETEYKTEFNYNNVDVCNDGKVEIVGSKVVYNIDGKTSANDWAKEPVKNLKTHKGIGFTSGIKIKNRDKISGSIFDNALGYIFSKSNNIDSNIQNVALFSTTYSDGHGFGINADNFERCTALFVARRIINKDWQNWADEYLAPNTDNENWNEFVNDSVIYSLFESKSNQSSLRDVDYKEKLWNIKNQFFFMANAEMVSLADENYNSECWNDANGDDDRFVYNYLNGVVLSDAAQKVLDKAKEIVRLTFQYRDEFTSEHPEYQLNNWDCGWYQIKELAKKYAAIEYDEFDTLYKELADKMRPMVYELGFLK